MNVKAHLVECGNAVRNWPTLIYSYNYVTGTVLRALEIPVHLVIIIL